MPILFSAVACDNHIVTDFASCDGNFKEIAEQVLSKIATRDNKMTYSHGPYLFHYIFQERYFYFCVTDKMCQRSRAFLFLNEIQRRFKADFKENFIEVLANEMHRYSEDYSAIIIRKGELDELNSIGVDSSESIFGEKILYVNNPDNISYSTVSYVGRTPEQISISVAVPNTKLYMVYLGICILIIGSSIFIFGPVSSLLFLVLMMFYLKRTFNQSHNKTE